MYSDIDLAVVTRDESLMKLSSSIADRILVVYGKLVSLQFIDEKDFAQGKLHLKTRLKGGSLMYNR